MQSHIWSRCVIALVTLTGVMYVARSSYADPVPELGLLNNKPVPANGVLTFSNEPKMTVRIVAADGAEVSGKFVRNGFWRPDEPFEVGTYTADVSFEEHPEWTSDRTFEVIAALSLPPDFVQIRVTPRVDAAEVLEWACCKEGAALVNTAPCAADCTPLCVPLAYAAAQKVEVSYGMDLGDPLASQVQVRSPAQTDSGQFPAGEWEITSEPSELCGVAEVFSWLDETTTMVSHCIPYRKPDLRPIRETVSSFGHITECTVPPPEYKAQWCLAQAYTCEKEVLTLPEVDYRSITAACEQYYELCEKRAPGSPFSSADSTTTEPEDATTATGSGGGLQAESGGGCSAGGSLASPSRPGSVHTWSMLWALFALVFFKRQPARSSFVRNNRSG